MLTGLSKFRGTSLLVHNSNSFTSINSVIYKPTMLSETGLVSVLLQILTSQASHLSISLSKTNSEPLPEYLFKDPHGSSEILSPTSDPLHGSRTTTHPRKHNRNPTNSGAYQPNVFSSITSRHNFPPVVLNPYYNTNYQTIVNTYRLQAPSSEVYRYTFPLLGYFTSPLPTGYSRSTSSHPADCPP